MTDLIKNIKNTSIKIICFLFIGSFVFSPVYGMRSLSDNDKIWVKENLLKPQANLIFILSINKEMITPVEEFRVPLNDLTNKPKKSSDAESENALLLSEKAIQEILSGDFIHARQHIDQAYKINYQLTEVYLAELLYQFYSGVIKFSQTSNRSPQAVLPVSADFFIQVQKDHPELETPEMIHYGLKTFQVFYTAMLSHLEEFKQRKKFNFKLSRDLQKTLDDNKVYFNRLLKNKSFSPYFSQLCLLMLAIVENDQSRAENYFQILRSQTQVDNNLFRLMTVHSVSKMKYSNAILHLNESIKLTDNLSDRIMLANLYTLKKEPIHALQIINHSSSKPSIELIVNQIAYTLLSGDFDRANNLYQQFKNNPALLSSAIFNYYSIIFSLLNNEMDSIEKYLNATRSSNELYKNTLSFIEYFKPEKAVELK